MQWIAKYLFMDQWQSKKAILILKFLVLNYNGYS